MCGVFGIASFKGKNSVLDFEQALKAMDSSLERRGPDGRGLWAGGVGQEPKVWLGHRRLSILDTGSGGAQPMKSPSGRWVVTFNGQIYNYKELARELSIPGFDFGHDGDTKVLVHALERWGVSQAATRLEGMFAFAAWNRVEKKLFLARDSFGVKPLYWHFKPDSGLFIFSSQLLALRASGLLAVEVDQKSVASFMRWGAILPPKTIFKGIQALEQGSIMEVSEQGLRTKNFQPRLCQQNLGQDLEQSFLQSLSWSARSHVPIGLFLSGGIDSSAIACGLKKLGFEKLKTFSIGFGQHKGTFDESGQAKKLADQLGFENFCLRPEAKDLGNNFESFVTALDQPSVDGFNTFLVSRLAAEHVKVALSGLGGDELFFGYPQMRQFLAACKMSSLTKNTVLSVASALSGFWPARKAFARLGIDFFPAFKQGSFFASTLCARQLFGPEELESLGLEIDGDNLLSWPEKENVDQIRLSELFAYTSPVLLRDSDALSMHSSLEVRVPFLNQTFAGNSFKLCEKELFSKEFLSKSALCAAIRGFVPNTILSGQKKGFVLPMGAWVAQSMAGRLETLEKNKNFDEKFCQKERKLFSKNPLKWRKIWALLVADEWIERFGKNP